MNVGWMGVRRSEVWYDYVQYPVYNEARQLVRIEYRRSKEPVSGGFRLRAFPLDVDRWSERYSWCEKFQWEECLLALDPSSYGDRWSADYTTVVWYGVNPAVDIPPPMLRMEP